MNLSVLSAIKTFKMASIFNEEASNLSDATNVALQQEPPNTSDAEISTQMLQTQIYKTNAVDYLPNATEKLSLSETLLNIPTSEITELTESISKLTLNTVDSISTTSNNDAQNEQVQVEVQQKSGIATAVKKSPKDFIFGKCLGVGSFGSVYLAVDAVTKIRYAIKVCEKCHIIHEQKQKHVRRERDIMHMLFNEPGFVHLFQTFQDARSLYFLMSYAKNGDLLCHMKRVGALNFDCAKHLAAELVLACEQMHQRNIIHRDLKPENILFDENMHILIGDFGSAKILTSTVTDATDTNELENQDNEVGGNLDGKRCGSFVGTAQYVSPEILQNQPISPATDLWALGCIIYQMISGVPLFQSDNYFDIFKDVLACKLIFPDDFDKNTEDLVRNLIKLEPQERLGAKDVIKYTSIRSHEFFKNIDFQHVRQQPPPSIRAYLPE